MCKRSELGRRDAGPPHSSGTVAGFTLAGLLSVLMVLALLVPLLVFSVSRSWSAKGDSTICMSNLRQLAYAMQLYTEDNDDVFPAHRNNSGSTTGTTAEWWGTNILAFLDDQTNLFHCPAINGTRVDRGVRWKWGFNAHEVGYGYNAFFLGLHPYQPHGPTVSGIHFLGASRAKRSSIVKPAENILFADKQPYGNPPTWGSMLWWPNACMDVRASASRTFEGVEPLRHKGLGTVAFNDGHVEFRKEASINPPADPASGNSKALINSRFWDPEQRGIQKSP
jgi:prepilin-type processing-associated H-X9-DG protein